MMAYWCILEEPEVVTPDRATCFVLSNMIEGELKGLADNITRLGPGVHTSKKKRKKKTTAFEPWHKDCWIHLETYRT